jgi:hypothetical protein
VCLLPGVLDVRVNEKRIGFAVDVLNSYLEAVEALGFRRCDLRCKFAAEVLVDDAIQCSEEGKDMGDEVAFVGSEMVLVCGVGLEVDLFGGPE